METGVSRQVHDAVSVLAGMGIPTRPSTMHIFGTQNCDLHFSSHGGQHCGPIALLSFTQPLGESLHCTRTAHYW